MDTPEKKTLGQIAYEAYVQNDDAREWIHLPDASRAGWERISASVKADVLAGLPEWGLVDHPAKQGDQYFSHTLQKWLLVNMDVMQPSCPLRRRLRPSSPTEVTPVGSPEGLHPPVQATPSQEADAPRAERVPKFKVGDEVQIRNPHHDWDHGMKKIRKVLKDSFRYVLTYDSRQTSWPESALKPFTWPGLRVPLPSPEASPSDWVPRSQLNTVLESRDGFVKQVSELQQKLSSIEQDLHETKASYEDAAHDRDCAMRDCRGLQKKLHVASETIIAQTDGAAVLQQKLQQAERHNKHAESEWRRHQNRADEAESRLASLSWTHISERMPTREDLDEDGAVWVRDSDGRAVFCHWSTLAEDGWEYWMRPIRPPTPSPVKEDDGFDAFWQTNSDKLGVHSTIRGLAKEVWAAAKSSSTPSA